MNKFSRHVAVAAIVSLTLWTLPAHATVNVLACEPEWAALATELGGDKVTATSATTGLQDPHRIEARPRLIARARNADLLACTGLELEAGWLPLLLQQSGNPNIQPGRPGHFMAGQYVPRLDPPARLDRSEGDIHASGNPHIQTDPHNIARVAAALVNTLSQIDAANAAHYQERHRDFAARWSSAIVRWEREAAPLRNVGIVQHHKNLDYLLRWLGMREVGTLEPKPGVEPGAAHLSALVSRLQTQPARMVLRTAYQDGRASEWLAARAQFPVVVLPATIGGNAAAKDLFGVFDDSIRRLLAGMR